MSRPIVLKFGGSSLATVGRRRRAALRVTFHRRRGRDVTVVVSASGCYTDRTLELLSRAAGGDDGDAAREIDRALSCGEDRSAAVLAHTLHQLGVPARSLRGSEAGVEGAGPFGGGRIERVDPASLLALLREGVVPVVSGFQALRPDGETVTLGRGGSDTTAVAIAAALDADCHIVTDVDAVYDRDPHVDPDARPLAVLDHASLVELTGNGARVVHPDAARIAADERVPLRIYRFDAPPAGGGTVVGDGADGGPPGASERGDDAAAWAGTGAAVTNGRRA